MPTCQEPPRDAELGALLRLLDDDTPEVRQRVVERLSLCDGDLSEWLAAHSQLLNDEQKSLLREILGKSRRDAILREWTVPSGGAAAMREDWEMLEAMLRQLSDFLHDGISLRQPLSDALDLLADEASESGILCANDLRVFLFAEGRLQGDDSDPPPPELSDLAWSLAEGRSNPIGLCLIFMLTARRLGLDVEGVDFPGRFFCRIHEDGYPLIIDCFDSGQIHLQSSLLEPEAGLTSRQRMTLRQTATPGAILCRVLRNLLEALKNHDREEDMRVTRQLLAALS